MKKILGLSTLALAGVLAFTGCSCGKDETVTATSYGLVHKTYLGVATVTHTGTDVTEVVFDEVMLPNTWATIDNGAPKKMGAKVGSLTTAAVEADLSGTAVKYIKIGNRVFEAFGTTTLGGTTVTDYRTGTFSNGTFTRDGATSTDSKIDSLYSYIQTEVGAKWYHDEMKAGNYELLNATGTSLGLTYEGGKAAAATKSTNGYGSAKFVWADQMKTMADYLVENDNLDTLDVYAFTKTYEDTEAGKKYFATSDTDVVTGATLTDFYDYMNLAQAAYRK